MVDDKVTKQAKEAADPEQDTDATAAVSKKDAPTTEVVPDGEVTPDNPIIVPASSLVGSDGRPSVSIPRPDPSGKVRIVYDLPEDTDEANKEASPTPEG